MRKSTWKTIGIVVLCLIMAMPVIGFVMNKTDNWNNPSALLERDLNSNNLLIPGETEDSNYTLTKVQKPENGLIISPCENGSVEIAGNSKTAADDFYTLSLATVSLKPGTYTLSSGYDYAGPKAVHLSATYNVDGSAVTVNADYGDAMGTFTLTAETVVTVQIFIPAADYTASPVVLYPVLVAGEEIGSFYK